MEMLSLVIAEIDSKLYTFPHFIIFDILRQKVQRIKMFELINQKPQNP